MNGPDAEIHIGNCLPLENIPVGTETVSYTHLDVYKRQLLYIFMEVLPEGLHME